MNTVKQDYEQAILLIKQGQLQEARQLLIKHRHPKTNQLLKKIDLLSRVKAKKSPSKTKAKKSNKALIVALSFVGILIICLGLVSTGIINIDSPQSEIIYPTIPANVTPYNPINAFAAIAPQTRQCLETDCDAVTVYQSEELLLLGIAEGELVEGSVDWYFVESNNSRFFIHENSVTFRDATPIVPTVDWRQEVQPVYYGDENTSRTNSSSSSQTQYSCSGNQYDCSDFSTCDAVYDYFRSCSDDPSNLDGDNDGIPCEDRCGY